VALWSETRLAASEAIIISMNPKSLVLISDLHIGGDKIIEDFNCEKELIGFLDHLETLKEPLELLILGDFFDLWKVENMPDDQIEFIIKQRPSLFERIKKFGSNHLITAIPGNHDHALFYNEKYKEGLKKYNINVVSARYFKREFKKNNKIIRIIGEHGNQVEPGSAFPDFNMPTESSLAYHLNKILVYRVMRLGNEKKRPDWVKGLDNVENELVPFWFFSKYFYHEVGPILKAIMIPMLALFGLAVPYFIFDIITEFYQPTFLQPLLNLLDTKIYFKVIIFILYFDMVVVILLFVFSLLRKGFQKRLNEYGLQSISDILVSKKHAYETHAKEVINKKNPYNEKADLYVNGHTHEATLDEHFEGAVYADTGSWKQLMKRMTTRLRLPSVFYPYYSLTYLQCTQLEEGLKVELREYPKDYQADLTILEKLAFKKTKDLPKPVKSDTLIKETLIKFK
jgi:UDP-2,3-diacylglucosamine pyrophosphatase LpxH